jgi:AMMECR1 domain-containing protein
MSVPIFMILKGMKKLDDEIDQKAKQARIEAAQFQPLDDKDLKAVKATIFVVIIATLPIATYMVLSLLI